MIPIVKRLAIFPAALFFFFAQAAWAQAPKSLGGFTLGETIDTCKHMTIKGTDLKLRHMEALHELEIKPSPGFKSGLVAYGACDAPNKVVRIKLKYQNSSKKFYDALLERFEQRFGEPQEWRGDPFHVVIAWKWHFTDDQNNRISMILQHNSGDTDQKMGNSVKLSLTSQIEKEMACRNRRDPSKSQPEAPFTPQDKSEWEWLLPR